MNRTKFLFLQCWLKTSLYPQHWASRSRRHQATAPAKAKDLQLSPENQPSTQRFKSLQRRERGGEATPSRQLDCGKHQESYEIRPFNLNVPLPSPPFPVVSLPPQSSISQIVLSTCITIQNVSLFFTGRCFSAVVIDLFRVFFLSFLSLSLWRYEMLSEHCSKLITTTNARTWSSISWWIPKLLWKLNKTENKVGECVSSWMYGL